MHATRDHHERLIETLKDLDMAIRYLHGALVGYSREAFAIAVENVTEAQRVISAEGNNPKR